MKRFKFIPLFIIYILINILFIYKYGLRQNYINIFLLLAIYPAVVLGAAVVLRKVKIKLAYLKLAFGALVLGFFLTSVGINLYVDGDSLNVDRWSAMDTSISALLDSKYPFTELDHLGGQSSNLTSLLIMGAPFYALGDVGFLQSAAFLFFAFVLFKSIRSYKAKILGILLLMLSSAYLWEVYAKSDLMSNFIFILGFIVLWYRENGNDDLKKPLLLGGLASFLFFTRIVSVIPLGLFLMKGFLNASWKKKSLFAGAAAGTLAILAFILLKDCPDLETLKHYNPLNFQKKQLSFWISLITIIIPLFYSIKTKSLGGIIKLCTIFLLIPISISFGLTWYEYGFQSMIAESTFDISYFNIISPFVIFCLVLEFESDEFKVENLHLS